MRNNLIKNILCIFAGGLLIASCQKMERPKLGDYPKDTTFVDGPQKFYAAFDGNNIDSVLATSGTDNNVTYVDGITGKAMQADASGYITYKSVNNFVNATSFTIAFWMKKDGPNAAGSGSAFAFGLATTADIWTAQDMFLEFEDAGNPSTKDSAAAKFYVNDQWFEFTNANIDGVNYYRRLPKILDGQWHQLAFVFDGTTSMLTTYIDGAAYTNLPDGFGKFNNNGGKVNFSKVAGLVVGGPGMYPLGKTPTSIGQSWMGNFNGGFDQFRMYGEVLSAAQINYLYTMKQ